MEHTSQDRYDDLIHAATLMRVADAMNPTCKSIEIYLLREAGKIRLANPTVAYYGWKERIMTRRAKCGILGL